MISMLFAMAAPQRPVPPPPKPRKVREEAAPNRWPARIAFVVVVLLILMVAKCVSDNSAREAEAFRAQTEAAAAAERARLEQVAENKRISAADAQRQREADAAAAEKASPPNAWGPRVRKGKDGLEDLVRLGALRHASVDDLRTWNLTPETRPYPQSDMSSVFIVNRSTTVPADMDKTAPVTFLVPKGVQRPSGSGNYIVVTQK